MQVDLNLSKVERIIPRGLRTTGTKTKFQYGNFARAGGTFDIDEKGRAYSWSSYNEHDSTTNLVTGNAGSQYQSLNNIECWDLDPHTGFGSDEPVRVVDCDFTRADNQLMAQFFTDTLFDYSIQ